MNFLKLAGISGSPVIVNVDAIVAVVWDDYTTIHLRGDRTVLTSDSVPEVWALIREVMRLEAAADA